MSRRYYGSAAHLIVSRSCLFHLATSVPGYVVSTVGEYFQPGSPDMQEVGCGRKYETMVFRWSGVGCGCGCGLPTPDDWSEIEMRGANTAQDANDMHEATVAKYEALARRGQDK